jgi:hypothetical protein
VGDEITKLNGKPVSAYVIEEAVAIANSNEYSVEALRNGKTIKAQMKAANLTDPRCSTAIWVRVCLTCVSATL